MNPKIAFALLGLLFGWSRLHAQEFSPDGAASDDGQVLNSGTAVFAFDLSGKPVTVNGVDFSSTAEYSSFTLGDFRGTATSDLTNSLMSGSLNSVLSSSTTNGRGYGEIYLSGLTSGLTYELQLFTAGAETDPETGDFIVSSEKVTDGTASGDLLYGGDGSEAYSIIDTFVASASGDEEIDLSGDNGAMVTLSALNLRQVDNTSDAQEASEPATLPLFLAGAFFIFARMEWRRRLAANGWAPGR